MKKLFNVLFLILFPIFLTEIQASSLTEESSQEKPSLELYYLPWCPYCQKVISYLQVIHKTVPLENLQRNPKAKADLQRIGGKTQVPCLIINGYPLYESDAIVRWLSENKECLNPA
ncbi:MAG: glutathione S-transferase N-terminal domain-containing protein [Chlamydiota bacterium]